VPAEALCPPGFREARVYQWTNEAGAVVFETVRYEHETEEQAKKPGKPEKTFRVRRPVPGVSDAYRPSRGDAPLVVFRKHRLAARPCGELHWTEGEEQALALEGLGFLATTTAGGAGGVRAYPSDELRAAGNGRDVVVHADADADGEAYAEAVAAAVAPVARSVRIVRYPDLGPGGDVLDLIRAGGTSNDIRRLAQAVPQRKPNARAEEKPPARLIVQRLSEVEAKPIEWLWPGRLARGKLHILGADYGDGKSTLTAWLASVISTGGEWPDGGFAPLGNVLFLLVEDAVDDTLKPRLALHGADETRIGAIEAVEDGGNRRVFDLDRHLDLLRTHVAEQAVDLIVIDPVSAFTPRTNRDSDGAVRDVLMPLVDLGNELGVAILALMHTGKPGAGTAGRKATQRLLGSTAYPAVARIVWMLAPTPDDPGRKVLAVTKSNIGTKPPALEWSRDLDQPVAWHGASKPRHRAAVRGPEGGTPGGGQGVARETLKGEPPQRVVAKRAEEEGSARRRCGGPAMSWASSPSSCRASSTDPGC
jgi:hypothetical protein